MKVKTKEEGYEFIKKENFSEKKIVKISKNSSNKYDKKDLINFKNFIEIKKNEIDNFFEIINDVMSVFVDFKNIDQLREWINEQDKKHLIHPKFSIQLKNSLNKIRKIINQDKIEFLISMVKENTDKARDYIVNQNIYADDELSCSDVIFNFILKLINDKYHDSEFDFSKFLVNSVSLLVTKKIEARKLNDEYKKFKHDLLQDSLHLPKLEKFFEEFGEDLYKDELLKNTDELKNSNITSMVKTNMPKPKTRNKPFNYKINTKKELEEHENEKNNTKTTKTQIYDMNKSKITILTEIDCILDKKSEESSTIETLPEELNIKVDIDLIGQ